MSSQYVHPRNQLVDTLQRLYDYGMTTASGGNLSIRDEEGNIWITPGSIDKGTLKPEDIVRVTPSGQIIGRHKPSCELPFHRDVYARRPDVSAVLHAHSPALVAFSLVGRVPDPKLVPGAAESCGKVAFAAYEVPGSEKLGKIISAEFERGADSVVMENHGAVMCGATLTQAFARFEALDYVARIQINAAQLGPVRELEGALPPVMFGSFDPKVVSPEECELRDQMAAFRKRAYKRKLLFSGSAFLSTRLDEDDFLITPAGFDPMYLDATEMVRVCRGKCEKGKTPSSASEVVRAVYLTKPWANAIIMTRPPGAMAYAATGSEFDSRTIPESYIMLRDMPQLPSDEYFKSPDALLKILNPACPVVMIQNCGILTTGKTLFEAFDRLEVAEFTAQCLLLGNRIGNPQPITQAQVDEIIEDFNLPR